MWGAPTPAWSPPPGGPALPPEGLEQVPHKWGYILKSTKGVVEAPRTGGGCSALSVTRETPQNHKGTPLRPHHEGHSFSQFFVNGDQQVSAGTGRTWSAETWAVGLKRQDHHGRRGRVPKTLTVKLPPLPGGSSEEFKTQNVCTDVCRSVPQSSEGETASMSISGRTGGHHPGHTVRNVL